jgi:NitT/TauT family transport system permease protein
VWISTAEFLLGYVIACLLGVAMGFLMAGFKLGIGRGLIGVVVAELFGARAGLGQLIQQSSETFNMPNLFAGVTVLAVAGIALTSGFAKLEQKLLPWRE